MTKQILSDYRSAHKRLFLLDYDGTLAPFKPRPELAVPTAGLMKLLAALSHDPCNTVVIISGRPQADLDQWFGMLPLALVAEHGAFLKLPAQPWQTIIHRDDAWKPHVRALLEQVTTSHVGSFIEEKATAMVWHFRRVKEVQKAKRTAVALTAQLQPIARRYQLRATTSQRIVEIRSSDVSKGDIASRWLDQEWGFILAAGDDLTDEDLFAALPTTAHSIKVGPDASRARHRVPSPETFVKLLEELVKTT